MRVEILSFNMRWIAYSLPLCSLAHPAGYGLVPGQRLRHSSCVHHVRSGAELQRRDDGVIAAVHPDEPGQETLYAPCAHADKVPGNAISSDMAVAAPAYIANGYVTSAWVTNDTNIPADGVGRLDFTQIDSNNERMTLTAIKQAVSQISLMRTHTHNLSTHTHRPHDGNRNRPN